MKEGLKKGLKQEDLLGKKGGMMGYTPLHFACEMGHAEVVGWLVNNQADSSLRDNNGNMCVHLAAEKNNAECLTKLLNFNPRLVSVTNQKKELAIHWAAAKGNVEAMNILLDKGAWRLVDTQSREGWTALHHAALNGHKDTVVMLTDKGANVNVKNDKGNTPLHMAVQGSHAGVAELLLERRAKVNSINANGDTPKDICVHEAILKLLNEERYNGPMSP